MGAVGIDRCVQIITMRDPMAILARNLFWAGDPHLDELSVDPHPLPGEAALRAVCTEKEIQQLDELQRISAAACAQSEKFVRVNGFADDALVGPARVANENYQYFRESLFESYPQLNERVSRSNGGISVAAPGKTGRVLQIPSMATSAAMRILIDTRSGFLGGVEDLNGDGLDYRFGVSFSRAGGMPILPFDLPIDDVRSHLRHLRSAHHLYETPIRISQQTTVDRARQLLMGLSSDSALCICGVSGRVMNIVTRRDLGMQRKDGKYDDTDDEGEIRGSMSIADLRLQQNVRTAPMGIHKDDAEKMMRNERLSRLPITDDEDCLQYMLTASRLKQSKVLHPFLVNGGLAAGVAIGIGEHASMMERIEAAIEEGAVYIAIETAHAYRRDVIAKLKKVFLPTLIRSDLDELKDSYNTLRQLIDHVRNKFKDVPLLFGFGTVTSPEAVRLLAALGIDVVKVGIGGGSQCSTFDVTGVGGLPFGHFVRCANTAAALGVEVQADGQTNSTRRFNTVSALTGVSLVQMGGWFGRCAEAATSAQWRNDAWMKQLYGEASPLALVRRLHEREAYDDLYDDEDHHTEGKVHWVPIGTGKTATVGHIVNRIVTAQRSHLSYVDAKNVEEGQHNSYIRRISCTPTDPL